MPANVRVRAHKRKRTESKRVVWFPSWILIRMNCAYDKAFGAIESLTACISHSMRKVSTFDIFFHITQSDKYGCIWKEICVAMSMYRAKKALKSPNSVKYYTCYSCYRALISGFVYAIDCIVSVKNVYLLWFVFIFGLVPHKLNSVTAKIIKKNYVCTFTTNSFISFHSDSVRFDWWHAERASRPASHLDMFVTF